MARVSVIIPTFNSAATLGAAVTSLVQQTFADWEAIIVDDGSTDSTVANARAWADREPRIKWIAGQNRGASGARNEASRHATSPWLLFLDADDLLLPSHLSKLMIAARAEPSPDIVHGGGAKVAADGRIGRAEIPPQENYFRYLASKNLFHIHACLVRRSTFEKFGGFDTELKSCEEWDLWQRFARGGVIFRGVEESLTLYRLRPQSLSHEVELLFQSATKVILRGHNRDPRVAEPLSTFAEGQPAQEANAAVCAFAIFCAGLVIGADKDPRPFLRTLDALPASDTEIGPMISMLQAGVPVGACGLYEDWKKLWPLHKHSIARAFAVLEERCGIPNLATRCLTELETRLRYEFGPDAAKSANDAKAAATRAREPRPSMPIVLMYHRINRSKCDPWKLCISPENFAEQLATLKRERDVVPLSWFVGELKRGKVPSRAAVLTFDDGYADALSHAKPLLEEHDCPATFFLTTGPIINQSGFWWDILAHILLESDALPQYLEVEVRGNVHSWRVKGDWLGDAADEQSGGAACELYFELWRLLKPLTNDERQKMIASIAAWAGSRADLLQQDRILLPAEASRLREPGLIDIGAHTVTHPSLPSLRWAEQHREIEGSRETCEDIAEASVTGFAYPFGDFDDISRSEVIAGKFDFACTTEQRPITPTQDLMRLPRLYVGDWDAAEFETKILRGQ